jgi:hypothetical protein
MLRTLKHITTIIAGGVALLPMVMAIVFLLQQQHIKRNMEKRMEQQYLRTITIPLNELRWIEKGKELKIGDELFDVKEYFIQNKKVFLTGLFDKEEKILHNDLERIINNQKENKDSSSGLNNCMFSFISSENSFSVFTPLCFICNHTFGMAKPSSLTKVFTAPLWLPPNAS